MEHNPEFIHLEARLGIGLQVTPEEFEILKHGDAEAHKLLAELVQSDRCIMGGDTYFPQPWNEQYLKDDLNFDLPSVSLHAAVGDFMKNNRMEELLINAIEWAIDCGGSHTHDLLRSMGITSKELEKIGYEKDNFHELHEWVTEESFAETGPYLSNLEASGGDLNSLRSQIQDISKGDAFVTPDGAIHFASKDAHQNLDEPDEPWIVYDEHGDAWFEEDIMPAGKGLTSIIQAENNKTTNKPSLTEVIGNAQSRIPASTDIQSPEKER